MIYIAPCIECGKRAVYNIEEQQMVCSGCDRIGERDDDGMEKAVWHWNASNLSLDMIKLFMKERGIGYATLARELHEDKNYLKGFLNPGRNVVTVRSNDKLIHDIYQYLMKIEPKIPDEVSVYSGSSLKQRRKALGLSMKEVKEQSGFPLSLSAFGEKEREETPLYKVEYEFLDAFYRRLEEKTPPLQSLTSFTEAQLSKLRMAKQLLNEILP